MKLLTRHTLEARLVYNASLEPRRILYTDDDRESLEANIAVLRVMGFDVEVAQTAYAALKTVNQSAFDFIISGLDLNFAGSLELARRVRSGGGPSASAKLLALTNLVTSRTIRPEWSGAFDGFLQKRPSRHEFRFALMKLLEAGQGRTAGQGKGAPRTLRLPEAAAPQFILLRQAEPRTAAASQPAPAAVTPPPQPPAAAAQQALTPAKAVASALPAIEARTRTWRRIANGLPHEFTDLVLKLAVMQAHCFIAEIANAGAAKNNLAVIEAHMKLKSLADCFEMRDIRQLLERHPGGAIGPYAPELFKALDRWQAGRVALKAVA